MKKYLLLTILAISIGFFMGKLFLEQYDNYEGLKLTSSNGEILYFINYGEYDSFDDMEHNTLSLENYIYNVINNKYYVYVGITNNKDNLVKINNLFSKMGFNVITEEFLVTNKKFLEVLKNYDDIISNTDDEVVLSSICSQILAKYEEIVVNDG